MILMFALRRPKRRHEVKCRIEHAGRFEEVESLPAPPVLKHSSDQQLGRLGLQTGLEEFSRVKDIINQIHQHMH